MPTDDSRARGETRIAEESGDVDGAVAFQRDLYLYWWAARSIGELSMTSRGLLTRTIQRRLRVYWPGSDDDRRESDDIRRYFLRRLLERLGLLRAASDLPEMMTSTGNARLIAAEPAVMARYLAHPLAERLRICARLWVAGGWWPDGKSSGGATELRGPALPRIALARRRLVEMLASEEAGTPVEIPGVVLTDAHAPRIIGATAAQRKPRSIAEERHETMRAALAGPLQWMGLVTRRGEEGASERPLVVSSAMLALHSVPDDSQLLETHGRVVIQPNLDIVSYPPLTAPALFALDSCAQRVSMERVAHFKLTRSDMMRAQQHGWSVDETARRLEALSGTPLPGNVRVRLDDWARASNRLRMTPEATVLTTRHPAILDALLSDRSVRNLVLSRLGPTIALVRTERLDAVRHWLLAHGEFPSVEHANEPGHSNHP